jgi:DNA-binding IclR family transcriptional regulator
MTAGANRLIAYHRDQDDKVVAAFGASAPASRFPRARVRALAQHVRKAADRITAALPVDYQE